MKKFFVILLNLVLVSSLLTVTALADGAASLYVSSVTAQPGETVTLTVGISNNPGISGLQVYITPDSRLAKDSYSGTGMMGQGFWTIGNSAVWSNSGDVVYNGQILTLIYTVPADAKVGDVFEVTVSASAGNWDGERVTVGGSTGTITVVCDHNWDNGVVTKEHSCEVDGEMTYTCSICGSTKTEVIPAAHSFNETVWEYDEYSHWHKCSVCGAKCGHEDDHTLYDVVLVDPQAGVLGKKYQKCQYCAYQTDEMVIPALPEQIDPVPGTGDITPQLTVAFNAVLITLIAAVAFVFKRKAVK